MRWCNDCKTDKDPEDFSSGSTYCKLCMAERARKWRLNNLERARAYDKKRWPEKYRKHKKAIKDYNKRYQENNKDKRAEWEAQRRARLNGGKTEDYSRYDIYKRDDGICYLCGDPIDIELEWPDTMSFSIDHVYPISLGGDDTVENVKSTHLRCNISKNDSVLEGGE